MLLLQVPTITTTTIVRITQFEKVGVHRFSHKRWHALLSRCTMQGRKVGWGGGFRKKNCLKKICVFSTFKFLTALTLLFSRFSWKRLFLATRRLWSNSQWVANQIQRHTKRNRSANVEEKIVKHSNQSTQSLQRYEVGFWNFLSFFNFFVLF